MRLSPRVRSAAASTLLALLLAGAAPTGVVRAQLPAGALGALEPGAASDAPANDATDRPGALGDFLTAVETHPSLRAARAGVRAAEATLRAAEAPFTLSGSYGAVSVDAEPFDSDLPDPIDEVLAPLLEVPERGQRVSLDATLRPFAFGDIRDLTDRRQAELARSALSLRQARAELEAQALEAAASLLLARRGEALAASGADLARRALEVTETRARRGGAGETDLARARQDAARARQQLAAARRQVALAEAGLENLVGDRRLGAIPDVPELPLEGSLELARARLDLALADIGLRNAERGLYPTAQASYTTPLGPEGGSLTLSLESRTLQPSLGYSYSGGAAGGAGGGGALGGLGALGPEVNGTFSIGVSLDLSPATFEQIDAARAQREAARAAVAGAAERAALARQQRADALRSARELLALAEADLALAQRRAADTLARRDLGIATDLDVERARLDAQRAELDRFDARLTVLRRILDGYRATATPPSEVLP